jgi:hypothetical protein
MKGVRSSPGEELVLMGPLSFAEGLARRLSGPAAFRFILQPLVAAIAGIRDGVSDAKLGLRPYGIVVLFDSESRGQLLGAGLKSTAIPLVVGVVIDMVVQWMLFQRVLLSAAILVGALLVGVPYIAARGLTNRILRRRYKREIAPESASAGR